MRITFMLTILLSVSTICIAQTTWYVPDDFMTIQQAIVGSARGDIIIVRPGTYVEHIDFLGKNISLKSEEGPEVTVIDGSQSGVVAFFPGSQGSDTLLEGFSILNGLGTYSGGILNYGEPRIRNNFISGNTSDYGGGISCWGAAVIEDNIITGNTGDYGGGIYCKGATVVRNNIVADNVSTSIGGGIHCSGGTAEITGNIITGNFAVTAWGGGIHCIYATANISGNMIRGNTAGSGAGINCIWSTITVLNNTVTDNTATSANSGGGGIRCYNSSIANVANTIFWNNSGTQGPEIWVGGTGTSTLTIIHSDVKGGQVSTYVQSDDILNWGTGMIDLDPLFVNAAGGDHHLTFTSPCKDTGDNSAVTELYDFEGDPRIAYGTVDMGADEFYPHMYIMGDKTPGGAIDLKLTGVPGSAPVAYFIGTDLWEPPLNWWPYGLWYLKPPAIGPFLLGAIPSPNGLITLSGNIPVLPPAPYTVYLHGIIGSTSTNLEILNVW